MRRSGPFFCLAACVAPLHDVVMYVLFYLEIMYSSLIGAALCMSLLGEEAAYTAGACGNSSFELLAPPGSWKLLFLRDGSWKLVRSN